MECGPALARRGEFAVQAQIPHSTEHCAGFPRHANAALPYRLTTASPLHRFTTSLLHYFTANTLAAINSDKSLAEAILSDMDVPVIHPESTNKFRYCGLCSSFRKRFKCRS